MSLLETPFATATRRAALATVLLAGTGLTLAATAAAASTSAISTNWSGYVARAPRGRSLRFTRVVGAWTVPSATCSSARATYSAMWVGLGGYSYNASALEQVGTDADCTRSGTARYSAWFELLPAAPVGIDVTVAPGDRLTASVTVHGRLATLRLTDLTTGERFAVTRRLKSIDVSSAEWIVEAPSLCLGERCRTLPLADFGDVAFSEATATAAGHTGTVSDTRWQSVQLLLRQGRSSFAGTGATGGAGHASAQPPSFSLVSATAGTVAAATGAFEVAWSESSRATEVPSPTTALPGFQGGSPP
jgi:hypothetical protein